MDFLEILKVIFYGIVEGITEWLPISSTGHMILVEKVMPLNVSYEFMEMFRVVIQLGAIFAVLVLYWNKIFPFQLKDKKKSIIKMDVMNMWFKIVVAIIPAGVIGTLWDDDIDKMFYNYVTVAVTLIVYGILFIFIENRNKRGNFKITSLNQITYQTAIIIGLFQVLALIPGTSRSGATILGAILIGVSREIAAEFTFFLAIPIMFGASLIKMLKFGFDFTGNEILVLVLGMLSAFVVSIIAIKFLMGYIKKHDFKAFGIYRIVLGILVLGYFLILH
ncbi:undecaprenyl-diphosphate phosphatase [Anaerocolumna sp. AGMB13020]|uniref:undecaprenyl-diphosphate phosphatase n=1 Tax=Anaerocolumna sp. AGMB13020 TaxID=3081750 RepID=UPI002953940E|nr:undecaprenyl-diphosphate phosphatase [Anaerocolumna sp. AGMB13020]WOO36252.1 undecaprenyl-diphosphate phosphatase [Anaerocolumna sp. AGMB13020]